MAYPLASGTYYYVTTDDSLETVLLSAVTGDVIVLSEGTHTLAFNTLTSIPDVSIRGMGRDVTTLHITDPQHGLDQYACFYDLKFTVPVSGTPFLLFDSTSSVWFESVTFNCLPGFEAAPLTDELLTFKNCVFDFVTNYEAYDYGALLDGSVAPFGLYSSDGLHNGYVYFENCVFIGGVDWPGDVPLTTALYDIASVGNRGIGFASCTFYGRLTSSIDMFGGILTFLNCVQYSPLSTSGILVYGEASGGDTGYSNYAELAAGAVNYTSYTLLRKLYLHDPPSYALRNESPARTASGNDYIIADHIYQTTESLLTTSSGAFQWTPETSSLYEPWYLDPADGFYVAMEDSNTSNFASRPAITQVNSQLDLFNHLRRIVYDVIHPSRCTMFWNPNGEIVIRASEYTFTLSTDAGSDAYKVFGSLLFSGVDTTET